MIARWRRQVAQSGAAGVELALLVIGAQLNSRPGWLVCAALTVLAGLFGWGVALRRRRAIADTPTSRIASAAQGYVELRGTGKPLAGEPLISRLRGMRCLWYSYQVEQRDGDRWKTIDSGESDASFLLDDGSGQCVVDVEGAEILTRHKETWTQADYRNTEWTLMVNDPVYVLGEFRTIGLGDVELDMRQDIGALLAEWKKDQPALLKRFDLNRDGVIDEKEWVLARQSARREVARMHREALAAPSLDTLRQPAGGQLYLISNHDPDKLARRYLWWSLWHLTVFFGALAALPMLWRGHV